MPKVISMSDWSPELMAKWREFIKGAKLNEIDAILLIELINYAREETETTTQKNVHEWYPDQHDRGL